MEKTKNQLYELIKDLKTKKEFDSEIKKRQKEYDGLLDEDTLALLIVDELGRNTEGIYKIGELEEKINCTVFGKVTRVGEMRSFNRKNGFNGRVINLELTDDTGSCNLALWDKDVDLANNKSIQIGANIKLINAYVKKGFNGKLELNSGRFGLIEIEPDNMPVFDKVKTSNSVDKIRGTIVEKEFTRSFFKDNGEIGFVTNIKLRNETGIQNITIWDEKVKEIQKFKTGDTLDIFNITVREKNNVKELHMNGNCEIKKR